MESFDAVLRTLLARIRAIDAARARALRTSAPVNAVRPRYRVTPTRWGTPADADKSPDVRSLLPPPAKRGSGGGGSQTGGAAAAAGAIRCRRFRLPKAAALPAPHGLLSCDLPGGRGRHLQAGDPAQGR